MESDSVSHACERILQILKATKLMKLNPLNLNLQFHKGYRKATISVSAGTIFQSGFNKL